MKNLFLYLKQFLNDIFNLKENLFHKKEILSSKIFLPAVGDFGRTNSAGFSATATEQVKIVLPTKSIMTAASERAKRL
jgi:hypothetical protein